MLKPRSEREYAALLAGRALALLDPVSIRRALPVDVSHVDPELIIKEVDAIKALIDQQAW